MTLNITCECIIIFLIGILSFKNKLFLVYNNSYLNKFVFCFLTWGI